MDELKPCPFCGSKDIGVYEIRSENCSVFHYVLCRTCWAKSIADFKQEIAVKAWNRRETDVHEKET